MSTSVPIEQLISILEGIDDPDLLQPNGPKPGTNIPGETPTWTMAMLQDIIARLKNWETPSEIAEVVVDASGKGITAADVQVIYQYARARYNELKAEEVEPIV